MADMCSCMITGRLTRDSELRHVGNSAVLNFSVAVGRYEKGSTLTSYFDVVQWGKAAESLSFKLLKGTPVVVRGDMRQEFWEQDGQRRSKWVLLADGFGVQPLHIPQSGNGGHRQQEDYVNAYDSDDDIPF